MSTSLVDVGPGGNCIYCRLPFENNRIGIFLSDGKICEGCARALEEYSGKSFEGIVQSLPSEWLLKSSGRIMGPFTLNEVEKKLLASEVVPLDEVSRPFERWKYLRDEVAFAKTIELIRLRGLGKHEDTGTNTHVEKNTGTDFTITQDGSHSGSVTPFDDNLIDVQARVVPIEGKAKSESVSSYGSATDVNVQARIDQSARRMWLIPLLAAAVFAMIWATNKKTTVKNVNFEELYRQGVEAQDAADHTRALKSFKAALELRPHDADTGLKAAALMIYFESQTAEAQRIINSILEREHSPSVVKEANVVLALARMQDSEYTSALDKINEALKLDRSYGPALINKAFLDSKSDKYQEAIDSLNQIHETAVSNIYAVKNILLASLLLRQGDAAASATEFRRSYEVAARYAAANQEYAQEARLLAAVAKYKTEKKLENVDAILDSDPEINVQFIPDVLVFPRIIEWSQLLRWCEDAVRGSPKAAVNTGLLGFCFMRANRMDDARKSFTEAMLQDPTDTLLAALYGYFMLSTGNDEAAKASLKTGVKENNVRLPILLKARACMRASQWNCARENYEQAVRLNPRDLSAIAGLAESYWRLNETVKATEWLGKGLAISNRYKPILWLKKEMNRGTAK
jgi:tetratricopeptide (TPR) repeat protein